MSTIKVDNLQTTGGASLYPARAWVNLDGYTTVAERDSGNVSSLTDNGTGNYSVNFSNSMSNANYAAIIEAGGDTSVHGSRTAIWNAGYYTTSSNRFGMYWQPNGGFYDTDYVNFAVVTG